MHVRTGLSRSALVRLAVRLEYGRSRQKASAQLELDSSIDRRLGV